MQESCKDSQCRLEISRELNNKVTKKGMLSSLGLIITAGAVFIGIMYQSHTSSTEKLEAVVRDTAVLSSQNRENIRVNDIRLAENIRVNDIRLTETNKRLEELRRDFDRNITVLTNQNTLILEGIRELKGD